MITTYSFVSGGYDVPRTKGKLFTEKDIDLFKEPTRNARMCKILSHLFIKDEWSLWTDADIELLKSPEEILEKYKHLGDIITFKHRARNCIYDEAVAVFLGRRETNREIVDAQVQLYKDDGYPPQNGLNETGCLLRHHTPEVIAFNNYWWSINCRYSKRDQLSFNYVAWKMGIKVGEFERNYNCSEDLTIHGHLPNSSFLSPQGTAP